MPSCIDLIRQQRIDGNENNKRYNEYQKIYDYFFYIWFHSRSNTFLERVIKTALMIPAARRMPSTAKRLKAPF